jgi:hypothetical protein
MKNSKNWTFHKIKRMYFWNFQRINWKKYLLNYLIINTKYKELHQFHQIDQRQEKNTQPVIRSQKCFQRARILFFHKTQILFITAILCSQMNFMTLRMHLKCLKTKLIHKNYWNLMKLRKGNSSRSQPIYKYLTRV